MTDPDAGPPTASTRSTPWPPTWHAHHDEAGARHPDPSGHRATSERNGCLPRAAPGPRPTLPTGGWDSLTNPALDLLRRCARTTSAALYCVRCATCAPITPVIGWCSGSKCRAPDRLPAMDVETHDPPGQPVRDPWLPRDRATWPEGWLLPVHRDTVTPRRPVIAETWSVDRDT